MKRLSVIFALYVLASVSVISFADPNLMYVLTRARQLHEQREFAASAKLLDSHIDNNLLKNASRDDSVKMVELLRLQGDNFYNLGVMSRTAELYEQALKLAEATNQKQRIAELCNELFIVHLNSGNANISNDLLDRSLSIYRSLGNRTGECKVLNNLGIMYYKQGNIEESLRMYDRSLKIAGKDSILRSSILTNMALIHSERKEYMIADKYLDEALVLRDRKYDSSDVLQMWINMAGVQADLGNADRSRSILKKISEKISICDPDRLVESYAQMAKIYMTLGDSIMGLRYGLSAQEIADSLQSKQEGAQLREILVRYNAERIEEHNRSLELEIKRHTQLNYVMIAFSIMVVAFSVFLVYRRRTDRRKNRLIREQKEQLLEFERMEHDRKEKEYRDELDHKNRELTAYSIDAASISELHKILIDSLKHIRSTGGPEIRPEINDIISRIQHFNRKDINEDFRIYFNEVHPDFLKKLSEKYPSLTHNDLRLSSYLYLGMSTKEIAALTFREIRSVESSRLRLRKKLGISGDQTLHDFLHSI